MEIFLTRITNTLLHNHNNKISINKTIDFTLKGLEHIDKNPNQIDKKSSIEVEKNQKINDMDKKLFNPLKDFDYLCDSTSENENKVFTNITKKKMDIMQCYFRFMRQAHIGNGLDIYWRKILDISLDISFDQYYEMIEYKTSEVLVFMIDCLCILHDVPFYFQKNLQFYVL